LLRRRAASVSKVAAAGDKARHNAREADVMTNSAARAALDAAHKHASAYLEALPDRPLKVETDPARLRAALGDALSQAGESPAAVVERLAAAGALGVLPMSGPRFFSFVIGGTHPAGLAADWLTTAWDQNSGLYSPSPLAAVAEDVAAAWLLDLLGLPAASAVGFVTGGTMANFSCVAAARHVLLARAGWDVEADGLFGAPEVAVVVGAEAHSTLLVALRYIGFGAARVIRVPTDDEGAMLAPALAAALHGVAGRPTLVCAQAGEINTGACDPFDEIADACAAHGNTWLHVDGAFGLWAQASPTARALTAGVERADSWGVDAHKWLNTPYDCGLAIVREKSALAGAMTTEASYLQVTEGQRNPSHFTPELSRRAHGFAVWATLAALGREGVRDMVERCCAHARRMRDALAGEPGAACLNDVVLNQAVFRFDAASGDEAASDALTLAVANAVCASGEAYLHTSKFHGHTVMRFSVCNHLTTEADIDRTARAVIKAYRELRNR
jgi:glutamate/tyrosine decarboxylase-like PLP-dependent enzyme